MMGPKTPSKTREAQLTEDLTKNLALAIGKDSNLTPEAAMRKITLDMLKNNPFVPPTTGCPVNDLPPELLAYIFRVGTTMEAEYEYEDEEEEEEEEEEEYMDQYDLKDGWTDEEDEGSFDKSAAKLLAGFKSSAKGEGAAQEQEAMDVDEEEDGGEEEEDKVLPFQVLVSHVCKHWRDVAIESPTLWTTLTFTEGAPFEKSKTWLQRSKGLPLDIQIDCTIPDEDEKGHIDLGPDRPGSHPPASPLLSPSSAATYGHQYVEDHLDCIHMPPFISLQDLHKILDIIIPHVAHWQSLQVTVSVYESMYQLLSRLSQCPAAPQLEHLELYHHEDCEDFEAFRPAGLREAFYIFNGDAPKLRDVALWGVHIDWDRSLSFLKGLRDLELTYHAKDVRPSYATFTQIIAASPDLRTLSLSLSGPQEHNDETNDWGAEPIEIPSLVDLVLCYHDPPYAIALAQKLSVPNVQSLALDFDGEDYTAFAKQFTLPMPKSTKSILACLQHLKISGLPCDNASIDMMYEQLVGLKTINLNCSGEEEEQLFRRLMKPATSSSAARKVYLPALEAITTTGIDGKDMRAFVEARKAAGVPIKRVMMSEEDDMEEKDEKWLREHVEELDFFEPSDSEEEFIDMSDEDDGTGSDSDGMDYL